MKKLFTLAIVVCILMAGCTDSKSRSTGVYMLLDTSGTYAVELNKAQKILNYLLGVLAPGDTLEEGSRGPRVAALRARLEVTDPRLSKQVADLTIRRRKRKQDVFTRYVFVLHR